MLHKVSCEAYHSDLCEGQYKESRLCILLADACKVEQSGTSWTPFDADRFFGGSTNYYNDDPGAEYWPLSGEFPGAGGEWPLWEGPFAQ